jgi:folate-binding protein YgfZ
MVRKVAQISCPAHLADFALRLEIARADRRCSDIINISMQAATQEEQNASGFDSSRRELRALEAGCGIYWPELALISLTGRDRVRWLNGMISNNVRDLPPGHGVYAFVLNAQGHILGDLYVFNRGESLVVELERAQLETVTQIFRRYIIMDKVELKDLSEEIVVIGMAGPSSIETLGGIGLAAASLEPLDILEADSTGTAITLVRGDNSCVPNYELWVPKPTANSFGERLREAGAVEVRAETLETFRIVCGIPKFGQEIRERILPQETGQQRALSFTKGCYIGQEIVERIRSRGAVHRALTGFEVEGSLPTPGTKIQSDGKDIGEITSVARLPVENGCRAVGLGYMRKEFISADKEFVAGDSKLRVTALPFEGRLKDAIT